MLQISKNFNLVLISKKIWLKFKYINNIWSSLKISHSNRNILQSFLSINNKKTNWKYIYELIKLKISKNHILNIY